MSAGFLNFDIIHLRYTKTCKHNIYRFFVKLFI